MTAPATPCKADPDLWFSEDKAEQRSAVELCEECPLSRYKACQKEGWNHKYGVWGGLTPAKRKRMNPMRFAEAVANATARSDEMDERVVKADLRMAETMHENRWYGDKEFYQARAEERSRPLVPAGREFAHVPHSPGQAQYVAGMLENVMRLHGERLSAGEIALRLGVVRRTVVRYLARGRGIAA